MPTPLAQGDFIQFDLNSNDFATARAVAQAINKAKGAGPHRHWTARVVRVKAPADANDRVAFLADLENLPIDTALAARAWSSTHAQALW